MTNIAILHGTMGKPFENWFPWLEAQLAARGQTCIVPHFPTPVGQTYANWRALLDIYFELGTLGPESVLIGHSTGAIFAIKYLEERDERVRGLITVAGYNDFKSGNAAFDDLNKSFFVDPKKLPDVRKNAEVIQCYLSDNDPYLPIPKLREFAEALGTKPHVVHSAGHFNSAAGYQKFLLLDEFLAKNFR